MKILLTILFCLSRFVAEAQSGKVNCELLQRSVESEAFKTRFHLCSTNEDLYIVDTSHVFSGCDLDDVCKSNVVVSSTTLNTSGTSKVIEIYKIQKNGRVYKIFFHRPLTGAVLILRIKDGKREPKILGYEIGAF